MSDNQNKRISILLFCGFLGAGKTTLLERLLPQWAQGRRKVALLVNDFGKLSLDGALLRRCGVPTREIAGGSIFCVCKQANLVTQLTEIARELAPDLLVMEASGLVEPTDTAALLQNTFLREKYAMPQVVTVVDAVNFPKLAATLPVLSQQIRIADALIVTKTDLADPETILPALRRSNPDAPVLYADNEQLYGELNFPEPDAVAPEAALRLCATMTPGFSVCNWGGTVAQEKLDALLDEYRDTLLRAKGVVNGRHLELVNGIRQWSDDAPPGASGLFFALKGNLADELHQKLKEIEE